MKRDMGSSYFNSQYQQAPVPAGGQHYKRALVQDLRCRLRPLQLRSDRPVRGTASKDGALNDYSVRITAHIHNSEVRILDVFRKKMLFPDLKREVIQRAQQYRAQALLIEDAASGTFLIQMLRAEGPQGVPLPIARRPEGDKVSRMMGVSGQIEGGQLLLPKDAPWLADFKSEVLAFPHGRHADQADALTQLMIWALHAERHFPTPSLEGPIAGTLIDGEMVWSDQVRDDPEEYARRMNPWGIRDVWDDFILHY